MNIKNARVILRNTYLNTVLKFLQEIILQMNTIYDILCLQTITIVNRTKNR